MKLEVGCDWGGMVMHAAREDGVRAIGVTLSRNQAQWAQKARALRPDAGRVGPRHGGVLGAGRVGLAHATPPGLTLLIFGRLPISALWACWGVRRFGAPRLWSTNYFGMSRAANQGDS